MGHPEHGLGERLPFEVRFVAAEQHHVFAPGGGERELASRPLDDPAHPLFQADRRAAHLEVEEVLGIEMREHPAVPALRQVPDGDGGRFPPVVPSSKGADHRRAIRHRSIEIFDVLHLASIPAGLNRVIGAPIP